MASSLQLEISSNIELASIGAVVRLATEAAPTKAEAQASAGHVSVSIPAGVARKISISQHYGSDFTNGLTLADVLIPNTAYKLYLYFPAGRITTTAEITGLNVTDDMAVVSFSTAVLPAEGDAKWLSSNGSASVASLDSFYFMEEQTGIAVYYFYTNFNPFIVVWSVKPSDDLFSSHNLATYTSGAVRPGSKFHFAYGSISGYTSDSANNYVYWIGGDKTESLTNRIQIAITDNKGRNTNRTVPVTRY
ncbi:hypothetical protein P0082_09705 [Candidatus Haliotispira prima]|uniref:Uncharacterized protein n=1 Tax=Candidatus Haliotispira prima TaxID=3034016 RepID=A0ABY8MFH8_9SPIO|nr:hypothetical protein P0082_09705 [Candidatus Haliotispira prima]